MGFKCVLVCFSGFQLVLMGFKCFFLGCGSKGGFLRVVFKGGEGGRGGEEGFKWVFKGGF